MAIQDQKKLGTTLWSIADQLRGAMNPDDFRDYMLSFLFLRYLSDNYEAAAQKELADPLHQYRGAEFPVDRAGRAMDAHANLHTARDQSPDLAASAGFSGRMGLGSFDRRRRAFNPDL